MQVFTNYALKNLNTFGFDVRAKRYYSVTDDEELVKILKKCYSDELFILGGGSNILLTGDLNRTVLHINTKGITLDSENKNSVIITAKAGENWHTFVRYCIEHDYGGLENLSLIPGKVGTAPIQNIGAYGIELQDCFVECKAIHRQTLEKSVFKKEDCHFSYRDSVFKTRHKDQYIITEVSFKLSKKHHRIHTEYGSIKAELEKMGIEHPGIREVSDAVINIRKSKLPDPEKLGNSGSFFKNPVISKTAWEQLMQAHPQVQFYQINDRQYKIAAGWLIDHAGLKGHRQGDAGVHEKQALVLVNYGNATGADVLHLARHIQQVIHERFGIELETEVNIID